jgi:phosphatidylserine synthase
MALTTNTRTQAGGVINHAVGRVVTDSGAAAVTTFTVGFVPRVVRFINLTDRIQDEWFEGMAAYESLHTVAVGTVTLETTNGISVGTDGTFTVKAATIVASKTFAWEAIG